MTGKRISLVEAVGPDGLITDGDWVESKDQDPAGDVRLIQLADIGDGEYLDKSDRHLTSQKFQELNCTLLQKGDVLISRMADPLARACIFPGDRKPCATVVDACIVRADGTISTNEWLKYAINSPFFRQAAVARVAGATRQRISRKNLQSIEITVPPLDEQRRIVDLLSRAEGIVRLRREAQRKAAEIIPAFFLDMFGDPGANPKGWPMRRVRDFVARFEGGKNLQAGSEGATDFRILKVSAVTSGEYIESESKPTPEGYEPPPNHIVRVGDMLFSRANTEALVGATAIVENADGRTLLPDKLWRFIWAEPVELRYMHALFQSGYLRQELGKLSSGTSASMRNISQGKLFGLRLPVAPLERQRAFALYADALHSIVKQQSAASIKAESTFAALLGRAFSDSGSEVEQSRAMEAVA